MVRELAPVGDSLVQMLSARDLMARCDAFILDLFRRGGTERRITNGAIDSKGERR